MGGWRYRGKYTENPEELRGKIRPGMWATFCCDRERFQLKNQEEIEDLLDDDEIGVSFYDTEEALLIGTKGSWKNEGIYIQNKEGFWELRPFPKAGVKRLDKRSWR